MCVSHQTNRPTLRMMHHHAVGTAVVGDDHVDVICWPRQDAQHWSYDEQLAVRHGVKWPISAEAGW